MRKKKIEFEEGSGNVFADLGLKEADELFARAQIGFCVNQIVKARKLKEREIARLLGIAQPEVSHLMNGHYGPFTTDKLLDFLKRLDRKVTIQISPHKRGELIGRLPAQRRTAQRSSYRLPFEEEQPCHAHRYTPESTSLRS